MLSIILQTIRRQSNHDLKNVNGNPAVNRHQKMHRKLTAVTISMTITFYVSWTPYAICSFLTMTGLWAPNYIQSLISVLVAKTVTLINPILYIYFNNSVSILGYKYLIYINLQILILIFCIFIYQLYFATNTFLIFFRL